MHKGLSDGTEASVMARATMVGLCQGPSGFGTRERPQTSCHGALTRACNNYVDGPALHFAYKPRGEGALVTVATKSRCAPLHWKPSR